jgi:hypothetical protein
MSQITAPTSPQQIQRSTSPLERAPSKIPRVRSLTPPESPTTSYFKKPKIQSLTEDEETDFSPRPIKLNFQEEEESKDSEADEEASCEVTECPNCSGYKSKSKKVCFFCRNPLCSDCDSVFRCKNCADNELGDSCDFNTKPETHVSWECRCNILFKQGDRLFRCEKHGALMCLDHKLCPERTEDDDCNSNLEEQVRIYEPMYFTDKRKHADQFKDSD